MWFGVANFNSFLVWTGSPLYGWIYYNLSVDLLIDIWDISSFQLLQINLL